MSPVLVNPFLGAAAPASPFGAAAAALNPTAWYRLNDASAATTIHDSSGNSHDGTVSAGVAFQQTGLVTGDSDHSALFDGSTVNSQVAYGSWMDAPSAFSIFAIIKTTNAVGTPQIMSRDDNASGVRMWQFRLNSGKPEIVKIPGTVVTCSGPSSIADGSVHDVGATYDGSNLRLYVDGAKVATTPATGSFGTSSVGLFLGLRVSSSGGADYWSGNLDELMYQAGTTWTDTDFANLHGAR